MKQFNIYRFLVKYNFYSKSIIDNTNLGFTPSQYISSHRVSVSPRVKNKSNKSKYKIYSLTKFTIEISKLFKFKYKYDLLHGTQMQYKTFQGENGDVSLKKIVYIIEHYKFGKLDGYQYVYYDNGILMLKKYYDNGLKQDTETKYHENSRKMFVKYFLNDNQISRETYYYDTGIINSICEYSNNKRNGFMYIFNNSGKIKQMFDFVNDKKISEYKYYNNGSLKSITIYNGESRIQYGYYLKSDKSEGVILESSNKSSLTLKFEKHYLRNKFHGNQFFYYPNGKLKYLTNYVNGKLTNKQYVYTATGKLKIYNY
jgi:antitoxin component YwqK of YwqJK toxin-antitoxin module